LLDPIPRLTDTYESEQLMAKERTESLTEALQSVLTSPNVSDSNGEPANLVDALDSLAGAVRYGLKHLGNADASTPMGAIEAHGAVILESADRVSSGLESIASAINELAQAVREARVSG
jgi:hypothetical protein